jgi:hypothetical protein
MLKTGFAQVHMHIYPTRRNISPIRIKNLFTIFIFQVAPPFSNDPVGDSNIQPLTTILMLVYRLYVSQK